MKRNPIKKISTKRASQLNERKKVIDQVKERANNQCEYADIIPEIDCDTRPGRKNLEVDELRGGAHRCTEWLDATQCRLTCPAHHDYKTNHKNEILDRLGITTKHLYAQKHTPAKNPYGTHNHNRKLKRNE
jgi:hypothetical protein